jgi:hypothetical protein
MKNFNLTIRVDQELHAQVKQESKALGISSAEFMRESVKRMLSANERGEEKPEQEFNIKWLTKQLETQLEVSANERKMHQQILLEVQAEKKALYDEIQRQKSLLEQPKARLPKFLSFLSAFAK